MGENIVKIRMPQVAATAIFSFLTLLTPALSFAQDYSLDLRCANRVRLQFFDQNKNELIAWGPHGYMFDERRPHAISFFTRHLPGIGNQIGLLTLTNEKIYATPLEYGNFQYIHDSDVRRGAQVLFNLRPDFGQRNGLPIVNPNDPVSQAWGVTIHHSENNHDRTMHYTIFQRSDLNPQHRIIELNQQVTDDLLEQALEQIHGQINRRLEDLPVSLTKIFDERQSRRAGEWSDFSMTDSLDGTAIFTSSQVQESSRHFTLEEIQYFRSSLCSCSAAGFVDSADKAREEIMNNSRFRVWDRGHARPLTTSDLTCGIS